MSEYMITTYYTVDIDNRGNEVRMQTSADETVKWDGDPMQLVHLVRKIWNDNRKTNLDIYIRPKVTFDVWNRETESGSTKYYLVVNQKTRRSKDVYIRLVEGDYYNGEKAKILLDGVKIPLQDATMFLAAA
jgi:hypothetical protein